MTLHLWKKFALPAFGALAMIAAAIVSAAAFAKEPRLAKIHKKIKADYNDVHHIEADAFSALDRDNLIIFDVRKQSEYDVSHIDGAIRVDPAIHPDEFARIFGDRLEGKTAVFYCSVGKRSSGLASRVAGVIDENGANASYNLTGGLFQWRNEARPLVQDAQTKTRFIHPYNNYWGRLINDKSAIRYTPAAQPGAEKQPE